MQIVHTIRNFFKPNPMIEVEDEYKKSLRETARHLASSLNEEESKEAKLLFESLLFMPIDDEEKDVPDIINKMNKTTLQGAISILLNLTVPLRGNSQ